jgi:hypothetical protein
VRDPEKVAEYNRNFYASHREHWLEYTRKRRARNTTDLRALKLLRGCFDCGYDADADALELDHVRGVKFRAVSALTTASDAVLAVEIAKCDVVCANCHSIRTANRRRAA